MSKLGLVYSDEYQKEAVLDALLEKFDCPVMELGIYKQCGYDTCKKCLCKSMFLHNVSQPLQVWEVK